MTILCLASYEKGHEFLREAKRQGCGVVLLTSQSLQGKAEWPMESIDEIFYMPDQDHEWNRADTIKAVSYLARTRAIDRIVALDDFDVEMAAALREHLRLPGMGETTVRHFRDKLAMRMKAREAGLNVPDFVHVLNYDALRRFMEDTPAPWVLKPRSMAGAIGIKKIHQAEELWPAIELLGDMQSFYLLEQFVPGDIFHVDCIVSEKQVVFAIASGYGRPPMEVSHGGGIFTTSILERESDDALRLVAENRAGDGGAGHGPRRVAHRIHQGESRRPDLFPGDLRARGRRAHRGTGGSGNGLEPVGRMGQGGSGGRGRRISAARRRIGTTRPC